MTPKLKLKHMIPDPLLHLRDSTGAVGDTWRGVEMAVVMLTVNFLAVVLL